MFHTSLMGLPIQSQITIQHFLAVQNTLFVEASQVGWHWRGMFVAKVALFDNLPYLFFPVFSLACTHINELN